MAEPLTLGEDLALLSLRVAQEVDRKLDGHSINSKVFVDFRRELLRASGIGEPDMTAFLSSDPSTTEVFAQAVKETSSDPISDVDSLGSAVMKIVEPLAKADELFPDKELSLLKTFCLSLHRSMMAQKLPPLHEGEREFEDELRFVR